MIARVNLPDVVGRKVTYFTHEEKIFSSNWIAVKLDQGNRRMSEYVSTLLEHVNRIYSHLKVHSFRKSLDSSTCELSFYHDVSLFVTEMSLGV